MTYILWFLPLKYHYPLSRRGALYMPFYPGRRNHQGMVHSAAGPGGMWACRPTAVAEDAVGNTPLSGRPYRPPLRRTFGLVRRAGCPHPAEPARRNCRACGHRGLVMAACGHAALRRSPRMRWETHPCPGGHTGRPYAALSAWSVGRGAHTPLNQPAGIAGPAVIAAWSWRHVGMPPYGGRRGAAGNATLSGRPYRPPLQHTSSLFPIPGDRGCGQGGACGMIGVI